MSILETWYHELEVIKNYLVIKDPKLKIVFDDVDKSGFELHTVFKKPYPSLIGAILGQKITYLKAKALRSQLYFRYGTDFKPADLQNENLDFLGTVPANIITNVTNYIIINNLDLETEDQIRSLINVNGIGLWTIDTTLLTCLKNWDIFPINDKFLNARLKKLYGNVDHSNIINNWKPYRSLITWYLWRWF